MSTIHQAILATSLILPALTTAGCGLFGIGHTQTQSVATSEIIVLAELGILNTPMDRHEDTGPGPSLIAGDRIAWAWGRAHGAVSDD